MQLQSHLMRVGCQISRKPAKLNYQWVAFCSDLVWLASLKSGLLHALKDFADAYDIAGMKISTSKTEVLHLLRNLIHSTRFCYRISLELNKISSGHLFKVDKKY